MKKLLSVICLSCALLTACNSQNEHEKPATVNSGRKRSSIDTSTPVRAVKDTLLKVPVNNGIKDKILGIWAAVGDENATFVITKNKITYPDQNAAYKYMVKGDSLHIRFDGFDGHYLVKTKGADTLILVGEEEQVYYRFKTL